MKEITNETYVREHIINILFHLLNENFDKLNLNIIDKIDLIDDIAMDSLTFISFLIDIEDQFNVVIPDNLLTIDNFRNVDMIVKTLKEIQGE